MISLVRSGPKTLVLESSSVQQLVQYLTDITGTYRKSHIFECYDNEDKSSLFRKVFDRLKKGIPLFYYRENK